MPDWSEAPTYPDDITTPGWWVNLSDDVLPSPSVAAFPSSGTPGKLYVATDTNIVYLWTGSAYAKVSGSTTSSNITDSTTIGRALMTAADSKAARKVLDLPVFDARNWGVIADGLAHNNVANLIDCVTQCGLAGGGTVLLPPGVVYLGGVTRGQLLTADSGRTYTNNGGVPLPVDTPITVAGDGLGVSVLKLSAGFLRAFDFWWTDYEQHYRDIVLRDFTVDRDNLLGTDIVAPQAVTSGVTLTSGGGWYTLPGVSPSAFANAGGKLFLPATNTGTAKALRVNWRVSGGNVQVQSNNTTTYTLVTGDLVQGMIEEHAILGNLTSTVTPFDMSFNNIRVERVNAINVADSSAPDLATSKANNTNVIGIYLAKTNNPATVPQATNITFRKVRLEGGATGIGIGGDAGTWFDNILFEDCWHDTGIAPGTNYNSSNYLVGYYGWVGRVDLVRCTGRRSGDVAYEIDQPWLANEVDCIWEDAYNGVFRTSFAPPARTSAGPPTTTLNHGSTMGSGASSTGFTALPAGVARSGLMMIDSELMWYATTNAAGTTVNIWRGLNGTTTATHADGSKITFIETERTRLNSIRPVFRNKDILANAPAGAGGCYTGSTNYGLPLTPITIQNPTCDLVGGKFAMGQFITWSGWCPDTDIEGVRYTHSGIAQTVNDGGTPITWNWLHGPALYSGNVPCPPTGIRGRNNKFRVHGSSSHASAKYAACRPQLGYAQVDLDIDADITIDGGFVRGIQLPPVASMVYAPGSRLGLKLRCPLVGTYQPVGLILDDAYTTIAKVLDIDLDLSEMAFTPSAGDTNYVPWQISSGLLGKVRFGRLRHPNQATVNHPTVKRLSSAVLTSSHTVTGDEEVVLVDTTAGPVTITLPSSTAGDGQGEAISQGRRLQIVDVGFAAATNNITIAVDAADKINGGTAGAGMVIDTNAGSVSLLAVPRMPGYISTIIDAGDGTATG